MPAQTNSRVAAGTIGPFKFIQTGAMVASDPTSNPPFTGGELTALQCTGAGVEILGIGAEWTNAMMGTLIQTSLLPQGFPAATKGQGIRVYGDGEETIIMVGSGYNVVNDQLLVSDASGNAIPLNPTATTPVQWIGARAIEAGIAGDVIRVSVVLRNYVSN